LSEADNIFGAATISQTDDVEILDGKKLMLECLDEFDNATSNQGIKGISTGIQTLDEQTDGLQKGEMIIVAAPPSMGKTTFAVNLLQNALRTAKHPVVMFSMEMPAKDIMRRMWSTESLVNYTDIRRGTAKDRAQDDLANAGVRLANPLLKIISKSPMTPSKIRAVLKRLKREYGGVHMAMVDYVQLMDCDKKCGNRNEELTIISRELKRMAMEFSMPFIVLSQLTKTVETQKRKPTNGDLRESGALAQDADVIMMVHREEKYYEDKIEWHGKAEIIITKSRNGKTGTSLLGFDGARFRFYEINNRF
jgi:replicative DNA helicase